MLLDITPLKVDNQKVVTLYDKDLTLGINLLIGKFFARVILLQAYIVDLFSNLLKSGKQHANIKFTWKTSL